MPHPLLESLRCALEPVGLNLLGVASADAYDRSVPLALQISKRDPAWKSAIVIGSGGGAFWRGFEQRCGEDAELGRGPDPLDRYTERLVEMLARPLLHGRSARLFYPFVPRPLSFTHLARAAGIGVPSLLGVLLHPEYGPWFALRAAIALREEIPATERAGFDPCPSCSKPCISACPGAALSRDAGWNVPACAEHRLSQDDCGDGCHARLACVYGREWHYPLPARRHHQGSALRAMASIAELRRGS